MSADLIIELELKSLMPVLGGLDQVANKLDVIAGKLTAIKGMNLRLNIGGGAGGGSSLRPPALPAWARPSALQTQINHLQQAQQAGNSAGMAAANAKILKALPVPKLPPAQKSLMERLGGLAMSSRIGFGGAGGGLSAMPLVGQMVKALGPEIGAALGPGAVQALGPLAAGVAVAAVGLKALFDAANGAAQQLTTFASAMVTSGGTPGEQGRLGALGGALGLSGQDISNMSRTLAERLAHDGVAAGMGARAGIHDGGSAFLQLDKAKNMEKAMNYIFNTPKIEDATIAARAWGMETMLLGRNLNEQTQQQLRVSGQLAASINSPQLAKGAVMFNAQMSRLSNAFGGITTLLGGEAMQSLTPFIEFAATSLENLEMALKWTFDVMDKFVLGPLRALNQVLMDMAGLDFVKAGKDFNDILSGKFFKDPAKDLKDAANSLLQATRQGTFGGGDRARGAMPSGLNGTYFEGTGGMSSATRFAASMGAFGV